MSTAFRDAFSRRNEPCCSPPLLVSKFLQPATQFPWVNLASFHKKFGEVAVESLNVKGMVRNRRLARAISDAGWSGFVGILRSKAESAGCLVVEVNPAYTSQECSRCGNVMKKKLSQRWHSCECGLSLHRDYNAALNILARGLARAGPAGVKQGVGPACPRSRSL